jgi:hypothetical protein
VDGAKVLDQSEQARIPKVRAKKQAVTKDRQAPAYDVLARQAEECPRGLELSLIQPVTISIDK